MSAPNVAGPPGGQQPLQGISPPVTPLHKQPGADQPANAPVPGEKPVAAKDRLPVR